MSIIELNGHNFFLYGKHKKTLNINIPGAALVFFKMDGCRGCEGFQGIFHKLSASDRRISYAIINLSHHRDVAMMSRSSTAPIQTVPFIMMYVDQRPVAIYKGKRNTSSLQSFIGKILASHRSSTSFMPSRGEPSAGGRGYPPSQGQAGYSQATRGREGESVWMPDIGKKPSMTGVVKGTPYAQLGDVDDEDDHKLTVPAQITPHNAPWEGSYHSLGGE